MPLKMLETNARTKKTTQRLALLALPFLAAASHKNTSSSPEDSIQSHIEASDELDQLRPPPLLRGYFRAQLPNIPPQNSETTKKPAEVPEFYDEEIVEEEEVITSEYQDPETGIVYFETNSFDYKYKLKYTKVGDPDLVFETGSILEDSLKWLTYWLGSFKTEQSFNVTLSTESDQRVSLSINGSLINENFNLEDFRKDGFDLVLNLWLSQQEYNIPQWLKHNLKLFIASHDGIRKDHLEFLRSEGLPPFDYVKLTYEQPSRTEFEHKKSEAATWGYLYYSCVINRRAQGSYFNGIKWLLEQSWINPDEVLRSLEAWSLLK